MSLLRCFYVILRRPKRVKEKEQSFNEHLPQTVHAKIEHPRKALETDELKPAIFDAEITCVNEKTSRCNVRVMSLESPVKAEVEEAYEGEDEHSDLCSMKRDFSDFDLQACADFSGEASCEPRDKDRNLHEIQANNLFEDRNDKYGEKSPDLIHNGHVSDPGFGKSFFWASPELKRSCSNLERRDVLRKMTKLSPSSKSQSYEDLQELSALENEIANLKSPRSEKSCRSADRVMLRKHSSSQVLPSGSRRLWWKLFLWSHRNIHKPWTGRTTQLLPPSPPLNRQSGYTSDTLELKQGKALRNVESYGSFTGESTGKSCIDESMDNQIWGRNHNADSGFWPQNQWFAFSTESSSPQNQLFAFSTESSSPQNQLFAFSTESSSLTRVDEWVRDLETQQILPMNENDNNVQSFVFPPSPDADRSMARGTSQYLRHPDENLSKEILKANSVCQSLNPTSTVAHISGIGLRAIPAISRFSSLRSVNLSSNFIVQITTGSLPKGLHTLNLSRNKISTIEGLRELTRLRILDLSYNRISRTGQGLSNCTLIKELYLAGNKISDVEGLHRLLKLTVLDLSFNKITTTKALGQLVANYNSLQALNLLGNPIQSNVSDDQLRKAVCGLLPKLVYLNKQSIKPQRAREVLTDSVAKAALGNSSRSSHRKAPKKASQGGSGSSTGHRSNASVAQKSRSRSRIRTPQKPPLS
ncbi:hypothetical protein L6164_030598 [Bauhinia variegata]|uniref:Uncharacterized protein n=1 Tax=Bauhinia variegata TaxID=167791 RepID=A0ACB9LD66_BAUVA|nr:hypothetical protein L6164_030598 [Bauhinia variegata]